MSRLLDSKHRMEMTYIHAPKWTIISVHPEVRELVDGDDEHFTGYKGLSMSLEYPRGYYGVIGILRCPYATGLPWGLGFN